MKGTALPQGTKIAQQQGCNRGKHCFRTYYFGTDDYRSLAQYL